MKKIYVLFNTDGANEIIAASEDRDFLCELMCDYFINDVNFQWYWEQQNGNIGDTYAEKCETAKNIWYDMIIWYDNYVDIFESEIV